MDNQLLQYSLVILFLSIAVLLACHRLKVPSIVGFLLTGILCGPHGARFVSNSEEVKTLAEIGIVLLLFTIGLELSIKKILIHKRFFFIGGPLQVAITAISGYLVAEVFNRPIGEAIFLGCLLSLSSTTIVMRLIQEKEESHTPQARFILGILIFQDIIVVPMMLFTPLLGGASGTMDLAFFWLAIKGIIVLLMTFFLAIRLVPKLLYYVAKTRSSELFLFTILAICLSVGWVTSSIGLSLALGAFLAGLIISESEYGTEAFGRIFPFQNIFTSFFFLSVGMLLNLNFFLIHLYLILPLYVCIVLLKAMIILGIGLLLKVPLRPSVISGMSLAQIGEFSLVLAAAGFEENIGTEFLHQIFLSIALLSMGLTPALIHLAPKIADWMHAQKWSSRFSYFEKESSFEEPQMTGHVVIIGYGFSGLNLARATMDADIPYRVLDMNADTVRKQKKQGIPIYYGDGSHPHVLRQIGADQAKVVAVLINDPLAALRIVEHIRKMNTNCYIIVRTKYLEEMEAMFQMGADEVVPDELGASIEIFTRVLNQFHTPEDQISKLVATLRVEGYETVRHRFAKELFKEIAVRRYKIEKNAPIEGKTVKTSALRKEYGLTIVLIKRGSEMIYSIEPETLLLPEDRVVLIGTENKLEASRILFQKSVKNT